MNANNISSLEQIQASGTEGTLRARLILDVTYDLNGASPDNLIGNLRRMCDTAIGEGMLTGGSEAEMNTFELKVVIKDQELSEKRIARFLQPAIASGCMPADDIAIRLARYGLMEPHEFVDEMAERMQIEQEG